MPGSLTKYSFVRVAVVSPEMKVADIDFNTKKIIEAIDKAINNKANFIVFPELSITGYTCADLFFQENLLNKTHDAINLIRKTLKGKKIIVILGAPIPVDGKIFNCAIVLNNGEIKGIIPKTFLCNSSEYYEERWFSSEFDRMSDSIKWDKEFIAFGADLIFEQDEKPYASFGIEICEDLWTVKPPSFDLCLSGSQILFNLSASNEYLSKPAYRLNLIKMQSARCFAAYAFASSGANESTTDMVFSGHSIIAENGVILAETERFSFDTQIAYADIDIAKLNHERYRNNSFGGSVTDKYFRAVDFSLEQFNDNKLLRPVHKLPFVPQDKSIRDETCREIFAIQSTGLVKRIKHTELKTAIIGISGGLDSTLALLVTIESYKKLRKGLKDIIAVNMPGFGTSVRTRSNAMKLAKALGITLKEIDISESVTLHFKDIKYNPKKRDIVYENAQARERTQILMDLANMYKGLVIGTGDLSEIALGWSTYNADHMSMYNVNSGVPKTLVKYIIQWAADKKFKGKTSAILKDISNTPVSPELLPPDLKGRIKQKTEDIIGPYELHDFFLYHSVRLNYSPSKILFLATIAFKGDYTRAIILKWLKIFYKRFFINQFKRSSVPDGIKVGSVSLSPRADWRMPSDAEYELWMNDLKNLKL
jgi:NAD+ synthase (glutamine-hydrolysing)